jgi:hypothetical protein
MRTALLRRALPLWIAAALCAACGDPQEPSPTGDTAPAPLPPADYALEAAPASMRRLTQLQYRRAITDLLGEGLVLPTGLEPDQSVGGLLEVGGGVTGVSTRGAEQYEDAAYALAEQALRDPTRRAALVPCQPAGARDEACARRFVEAVGARAWRRPLDEAEVARLVAVADRAAETLGDFYLGLEYALAAILQSPWFLFRVELGEPDGEGARRLTQWELAARLSFFLWNRPPDEALREAAAAGALRDPEALRAQAARMLDDPLAREGLRNFFTEYFELYRLDALNKDPLVFPHMDQELGPSAREETLRVLEALVFEEDGDYRDALTRQETFVNRKLAALYDLRAPTREGFGRATLPPDGPRVGLLGHASLLSLHAHPVSSSATLRGIFIRERLLCQTIPDPPSNVDTSIPEPSGETLTLRDRVAEHLTEESCAACHLLMDPLGLGLEHFDGVGRARARDNGALIDASGDLDGIAFDDPRGLAQALRDHEALPGCLVRHLYRYATGHVEVFGEREALRDLNARFAHHNYRVKALLLELIQSPAFSQVGEVNP